MIRSFLCFLVAVYQFGNRYPRRIALCMVFLILGVMYLSPWHVAVVRHHSVRYKMVIWTENKGDLKLSVGDYVLVPWKGEDPNGVGLKDGLLLVKRVGCLDGGVLSFDGHVMFCDNDWLGVPSGKTPESNKILKPYPYASSQVLKSTEMFLIGDHQRSYDSRYLGLFSTQNVLGKVIFGI